MDTGYKYPDGEPIYNGDMILLNDGMVAFVWFDERINIFSIKYFKEKPIVASLENTHKFITKYLG